MIVFDLQCRAGSHRFEGWFASSEDYARQQERGLVTCPVCGSPDVEKAVMAPAVGRKGNQLAPVSPARPKDLAVPDSQPAASAAPALPPEAVAVFQALAELQAETLKSSRWVGGNFAEDARAMYYGEKDAEPIHGQATIEEARELVEEGIDIAPILVPIVPPGETN